MSNLARVGGERWSLNPMVTCGLIGALLLLVIVAVRTSSGFVQTTLWVSETRNMLEELRQWYAQIEITDSDEMRYLNGRDPPFKQAVEQDQASTQKEMNDVVRLVQNDPGRRAAIARIQDLAARKAEFMARRMSEAEHHQNLREGWMAESNDLLWPVRRAISDLTAGESAELELRGRLAERLGRRVLFWVPATIGLSLLILAATILLLNREVRQRIRAEGELREANRLLDRRVQERTGALQAAVSELEGFSYSVAHDLRAPIRAIGGYAAILGESCASALPGEGRELVDTVGKEAARMGRLIDDLLRFSRLNRQSMVLAPVDMTKCAQDAFEQLAAAEPGRKLDLHLSTLPKVAGDGAMLRQVWVQLLSNALKFTRGRPIAVIEISCLPSATEFIYCVKDNGAGFDMRYSGNLFRPFQRLHSDAEFPGSGIGLALVERIIRRHGGRVWAEGEPCHGAAFYFALPQQQV
jgi:signal transduction histidine kinase